MHLPTAGINHMSKTHLEKVFLHNHQLELYSNSRSKKQPCYEIIENPANEKTTSGGCPPIPNATTTTSCCR